MKIGDKVLIRGCVDEIRKDCVIIRNEGGYFGTVASEIIGVKADAVPVIRCKDCKHSETDHNGIPFCTKFWRFMEYCSSGKRKEE